MTATDAPVAAAWRRRLAWGATASGIAVADLAIKGWAVTALKGSAIEAGPVDLRLAFNPGAAFSIAANASDWVLLSVTMVITVAVAVAGYRVAPHASLLTRVALAALLGGAAANVIDRIPDGVVTDYLHTGWWPTFNLADSFIVLGAITLVIASLFTDTADSSSHEAGRG